MEMENPQPPEGNNAPPPSPALAVPPTADGGKASSNVFKTLFGTLFNPQSSFEALNRKPAWFLPFVFLLILFFLYFFTIVNMMGPAQFMRSTLGANPSEKKVQQIEQFITMMEDSPAMKALIYVNPAVAMLFMPLIVAGVMMLAVTLSGGTTSFKKSLSLVNHIYFVSTLVTTIFALGPLLLTRDFEKFDMQNPIASNIGFFLSPESVGKFFYSLASSIDVISFWMIYLFAVGYTAISENLKRKTAFSLVIAFWLVWVIIKSSLAVFFG